MTDANDILEELGTPGSLEFQDPDGNVVLTGDDVANATARYVTQDGKNEAIVELTFTDDAAETFSQLTADNIGKTIPIVYDGEIISNPVVNQQISGGTASIEGMESFQAAETLASQIRIGSLSLELEELTSQVVGASLRQETIPDCVLLDCRCGDFSWTACLYNIGSSCHLFI